MAKRKPQPSEPNEDAEEGAVPEGPCPWNVEIEFNDPTRKSAMHAVRNVLLDSQYIQLQLEDGKLIAYAFDTVHKVLSMHSSRFDAFLSTGKESNEGEQAE